MRVNKHQIITFVLQMKENKKSAEGADLFYKINEGTI